MFSLRSSTLNFEELPHEYVVNKFYELGFFAQFNNGANNYCCSCPICMEGDTGIGKIKRCFYLPDKNIIYCHRCGWSSRPYKWIKEVSGMSSSEIRQEIIENDYEYINLDKVNQCVVQEEESDIDTSLPDSPINLFDKHQVEFYSNNINVINALKYIKQRRLNIAVNKPDAFFLSLTDATHANRLVIPYYDDQNNIAFYQSRDITGQSNIRYLSKYKGVKSVFNLNKLDFNKSAYFIFEGPFDSCFVKNGVAIGGITAGKGMFTGIQGSQLNKIFTMDRIWVLDSQYLDSASREKSEYLLEEGETVFIWPEKDGKKYKDFNEMCIDKELNEITEQYIFENSYSGSEGLFNLKII